MDKKKGFKEIMKDYFKFYNQTLRRKHLVIYIITLIVFAIFLSRSIDQKDEMLAILEQAENSQTSINIFKVVAMERIPVVFLTILAGIVPYAFIPLISVIGYPYILVLNIFNLPTTGIIIGCIGAIVQIFGVSLAIATGIYYCSCSTKKWRYNTTRDFGLNDLKLHFYESTSNNDKYNKVKEKIDKKKEKKDKLNVKVNYKMLLISFVVSTVLVSLAAIITGV